MQDYQRCIPLDSTTFLYSKASRKSIPIGAPSCHLPSSSWGLWHIILLRNLPWSCYYGLWLYLIKAILFVHMSTCICDWYLEICDSSWLEWSIGIKHALTLLHHLVPSAPSLLLALLQSMVLRSQVMPSLHLFTILIHTLLCILHMHIFEFQFLFHTLRYSIPSLSKYTSNSWLRSFS